MQPLIDADILLYEIGYAAEAGWQSEGFPPFDYAANLLDMKVANICALVGATVPPKFYLTGKTNFRTGIAKLRPYKERPSLKPFHYYNLKAYIKGKYDWYLTELLEADDLLAIEQTSKHNILEGNPLAHRSIIETIICTRDKDLRSVPGWHYGWELGNQPQFGPELVGEVGYLRISENKKKLSGVGSLFFYAQCLTGDSVDTVPGLPRFGPVKAFEMLSGCPTTYEAFKRVLEAYRAVYEDVAENALLEQGRLLWMTREIKDNKPVLWEFPTIPQEEDAIPDASTIPILVSDVTASGP